MTGRLPDYFGLDRFSISPADVVRMAFRCEPSAILPRVLMTPIWGHEVFLDFATLSETVTPDLVYTLEHDGTPLTLLRSGVGAPLSGDAMLALACTPCNRVVFVGSVGGLTSGMRIGDLLLPTESVTGDGFSAYLPDGPLGPQVFLSTARPDSRLRDRLKEIAMPLCRQSDGSVQEGRVYSADSIVAQFHHVDEIVGRHECIGIEMETAAVFRAARLVGIPAAALLQISDVTPDRKSLFSGRTDEDQRRRKMLRRRVVAPAALQALTESNAAV